MSLHPVHCRYPLLRLLHPMYCTTYLSAQPLHFPVRSAQQLEGFLQPSTHNIYLSDLHQCSLYNIPALYVQTPSALYRLPIQPAVRHSRFLPEVLPHTDHFPSIPSLSASSWSERYLRPHLRNNNASNHKGFRLNGLVLEQRFCLCTCHRVGNINLAIT